MRKYMKELYLVADKIRHLREEKSMTQSELARELDITRSSVNAWEMGLSVPSTQYLIELARIFNVSTDFLLGVNPTVSLSVVGLSDDDIHIVRSLIEHLKSKNGDGAKPSPQE